MQSVEILTEIDSTLDRLIRNAEAVQHVRLEDLSEMEVEAFKKTQESLIQHLIHMDQCFEKKAKTFDKRSSCFKLQDKLLKFEKMKRVYRASLEHRAKNTSILSKRKFKKLLVSR